MKTLELGNYICLVEDEEFNKEVFDADTQSGERIQFTRQEDDSLKATNGMNGYGENIAKELIDLEVKVTDGPFSDTVGEVLDCPEPGHYPDHLTEPVTTTTAASDADVLHDDEQPGATTTEEESK